MDEKYFRMWGKEPESEPVFLGIYSENHSFFSIAPTEWSIVVIQEIPEPETEFPFNLD